LMARSSVCPFNPIPSVPLRNGARLPRGACATSSGSDAALFRKRRRRRREKMVSALKKSWARQVYTLPKKRELAPTELGFLRHGCPTVRRPGPERNGPERESCRSRANKGVDIQRAQIGATSNRQAAEGCADFGRDQRLFKGRCDDRMGKGRFDRRPGEFRLRLRPAPRSASGGKQPLPNALSPAARLSRTNPAPSCVASSASSLPTDRPSSRSSPTSIA